jgi:hypothetical protein
MTVDGLTFDSPTHVYRLFGEPIPSVTQVLEAEGIAPRMGNWPGVEFAGNRGTAVHQAIALYADDDLEEGSLDDAVVPYFESFLGFEAERGLRFTLCEYHTASLVFRVGGTLDFAGRLGMQTGEPWILDWKSGAAGPSHEVQVSAYKAILHEECLMGDDQELTELVEAAKLGLVYLNADGSPAELSCVRNYEDCRAVFQAAARLYHWKKQRKLA